MSLTEQFIQQRQETLERYQNQGYQELHDFLQESGITEAQLLVAGWLETKGSLSTTELQDYRVSEKGQKFFKELKRYQLILVNEIARTQLLKLPELKTQHPV